MKKIMFLVVVTALVLSISILSVNTVLASEESKEEPQPVLVPVILDDIYYDAGDFNRINRELSAKGVDLIFTINPEDGSFYAFTTIQGYNEYAAKYGLPAYVKPDANNLKNEEVVLADS